MYTHIGGAAAELFSSRQDGPAASSQRRVERTRKGVAAEGIVQSSVFFESREFGSGTERIGSVTATPFPAIPSAMLRVGKGLHRTACFPCGDPPE